MAGTHEGRVLVFPQLTEALTPFDDKPQARKIVDADGGNLTLMELAAGQSWHEHHSVHPIFVQVLKGEVIFHVKDRDITLVPGKPIHVTAKLLHSLRAVKDSTLLVTMLTGESLFGVPGLVTAPLHGRMPMAIIAAHGLRAGVS